MKLLLAWLLLAAPVAEQQYFRLERPVQASSASAPQTCVEADAALYRNAESALADVRLYRNGSEVPYVQRSDAPPAQSTGVLTPLNLGTHGNATEFEVEMPSTPYSDLEVEIAGRNFFGNVEVRGGEGKEQRLLGRYPIFDFTAKGLGRSTALHLPVSDARRLHLRIDGDITPDRIGGVRVLQETPATAAYIPVVSGGAMQTKGRTQYATLDVPAHVPVDRVLFTVGVVPQNFSRTAHVHVQPLTEDEGVTSREFNGTLLRVHTEVDGKPIDEEQLSVTAVVEGYDAPAQWQITLENGDDAPLPVTALKLAMQRRELCFAGGGEGVVMRYGDPALQPPRYDYAAFYRPDPAAAHVMAGKERPNPGYHPRPNARPFTERHPLLLWSALAAAIALLGALALRSRPVE